MRFPLQACSHSTAQLAACAQSGLLRALNDGCRQVHAAWAKPGCVGHGAGSVTDQEAGSCTQTVVVLYLYGVLHIWCLTNKAMC
jgi:hypothetical protein